MQTMMNPGIPRVIARKEGRALLNPEYKTLYHRRALAAGPVTAQTLLFFRDFTAATALDTNMTVPGQIPKPYEFSCFGVSLFVDQGTIAADWHRLLNESVFFLRLSDKDKLQEPLHMIPSAGGLTGFADGIVAPAPAVTEMVNGLPMPTNFFPVSVQGRPVHFASGQTFQATIQTFNAVAFTAAINLFVHLHGIYYIPMGS